jgi:peptidoglycan hydrolase-like protein with peptidoglycan-binding domain
LRGCIAAYALLACLLSGSCTSTPLAEQRKVPLGAGIDLQSLYRHLDRAGFQRGLYNPNNIPESSYPTQRFQRYPKLSEIGVLEHKTWELTQRLDAPGLTAGPVMPSPTSPAHVAFASTVPVSGTSGQPSALPNISDPEGIPSQVVWPTSVIVAVQVALMELGYEIPETNGTLDATTQQAVRQFQKDRQLPENGTLGKETLLVIFDERCKHGCTMTVLISAAEEGVTNRASVAPIKLSGTRWWPLFVQGMQYMLTQQGYNMHGVDGTIGPATQRALRVFQRAYHLAENGEFTGETVLAILATSCQKACEFAVTILPLGQTPAGSATTKTDKTILRKLDPAQPTGQAPLEPYNAAYAPEKVECSDISGAWVTLYQGTIVDWDERTIALRLEERFGYRNYPNQDGINRTDWWCIPRRRHCYSTISFSDWGGTFTKNSVQRFPIERVYNARLGVINSMSTLLQQQCQR